MHWKLLHLLHNACRCLLFCFIKSIHGRKFVFLTIFAIFVVLELQLHSQEVRSSHDGFLLIV